MDLKQLTKTFHDAWEKAVGYGTVDPEEAGIRAVVEALRDHLRKETTNWSHGWGIIEVENEINDILATGGDQAAGGDTQAVGSGGSVPETAQAPAADPSPEVCEWSVSRDPDGEGHYETRCGNGWMMAVSPPPARDGYNFCPSCGKPIVFKEPKP